MSTHPAAPKAARPRWRQTVSLMFRNCSPRLIDGLAWAYWTLNDAASMAPPAAAASPNARTIDHPHSHGTREKAYAGPAGRVQNAAAIPDVMRLHAEAGRRLFRPSPGEAVVLRVQQQKSLLPDSCTAAKQHLYSTTSSARARSVGGMSRPSALAVLRLMTSSKVVGSWTGRSPGFSPLRMRSM